MRDHFASEQVPMLMQLHPNAALAKEETNMDFAVDVIICFLKPNTLLLLFPPAHAAHGRCPRAKIELSDIVRDSK
jgi:hypothetical protein